MTGTQVVLGLNGEIVLTIESFFPDMLCFSIKLI